MTRVRRITRRQALKATAGAVGATLPLVHVQTAAAAGKLTMGIWDHWVPAANPVMKGLVDEWAAKNKVDVTIDLISSAGNKMILTQAAEAQARSGHDILAFDQWASHQYADKLTPVNDVVDALDQAVRASEQGRGIPRHVGWKMVGGAGRLGLGAPAAVRTHLHDQELHGRGCDRVVPGQGREDQGAAEWTYEKQLKMAEQCHKAGHLFALGCGANSTDSNQTWGATFGAFGAHLVDAKGNITVDSDPVREVLDYVKRFVPYCRAKPSPTMMRPTTRPSSAGAASLIWNPPSAWAVAKRDAPAIAADTWHFPTPRGKMGRLVPHRPYFWGIWKWAQNKSAAKDLMAFLSQRDIVAKLSVPAAGYDIPPFLSMADLPVWAELEPPKGTIYNYPVRPHHDAEYYIVGSSAPPDIGVQIWSHNIIPGMVARIVSGQRRRR